MSKMDYSDKILICLKIFKKYYNALVSIRWILGLPSGQNGYQLYCISLSLGLVEITIDFTRIEFGLFYFFNLIEILTSKRIFVENAEVSRQNIWIWLATAISHSHYYLLNFRSKLWLANAISHYYLLNFSSKLWLANAISHYYLLNLSSKLWLANAISHYYLLSFRSKFHVRNWMSERNITIQDLKWQNPWIS